MFWIVVVVTLVVAFLAGYALNTKVRPFATSEVQGVKLETLISPMLTLAVLMLAFVLVQNYTGFRAARDAAALEAGRVLVQYDLADLYDDEFALPMQEGLICYTRAVVHQEFPHLAESATPEATVSLWGRKFDVPLAQIAKANPAQPFGALLSVDKERLDGRRLRIVGARETIPMEVQILLLGLSALAVFGIAAFTLPYVHRRVQAGALIVVVLGLGAVQLTIVDLAGRYSGQIQVGTADYEIAETIIVERFEMRYPDTDLPCDAEGLPTS